MIRYVGNLDFKEQPGTVGPNQAEVGLDVLVRTFRGKTSDKYKFFNVTIGTPDRQYPALFATNIEPTDLEGGLSDFRVTYKGMLNDGNMRPVNTVDSIVIKSGTVNAEYVYERLETSDGKSFYSNSAFNFTGAEVETGIPYFDVIWVEKSVPIQANVSYYARATTYNYVSRNRPTGPQFQNVGVNGFNQALEIFNTVPSGSVQVPRFPTISTSVTFTTATQSEYNAFQAKVARVNSAEMRFKRITVKQSEKKIICSNFTAELQGVWWVCSETWEVELAPTIADPTPNT